MLKKNSCSYKHHPYLTPPKNNGCSPTDCKSKMISRSLYNISDSSYSYVSSSSTSMPRSMSAIDENKEGWALSFCGVLPSQYRQRKSTSCFMENMETEESLDQTTPCIRANISRSYSCQVTGSNDQSVTPSSSSPIAVPRRKGNKQKSNNRSSGGYFFDKYMKRFRAKYGRSRTTSTTDSEASDDLKTDKPVFSVRSNRQDMIFDENVQRVYYDSTPFTKSSSILVEKDDLYPLRYGTSFLWEPQVVPRSSTYDSGCGTVTSFNSDGTETQQREDYMVVSSVFPSSPPKFWNESSYNDLDDVYAQPLSPVSSACDSAACRYSDSNSETLKAMETLYLCNFKVAVQGDWLCLKEICDDAVASNALIASTGKCMQCFPSRF